MKLILLSKKCPKVVRGDAGAYGAGISPYFIKPGMAELIVKGKGLYTGKKKTTVTIVDAPEK
jgi:hypothetical protein